MITHMTISRMGTRLGKKRVVKVYNLHFKQTTSKQIEQSR